MTSSPVRPHPDALRARLGPWLSVFLWAQGLVFVGVLLDLPEILRLFEEYQLWDQGQEDPLARVLAVGEVLVHQLYLWGALFCTWMTVERSPASRSLWMGFLLASMALASINRLLLEALLRSLVFSNALELPDVVEPLVGRTDWLLILSVLGFLYLLLPGCREALEGLASADRAPRVRWAGVVLLLWLPMVANVAAYYSTLDDGRETFDPAPIARYCDERRANHLCLQGSGGDLVVGGRTLFLTRDDGRIFIEEPTSEDTLRIHFEGWVAPLGREKLYTLELASGDGSALAPGVYHRSGFVAVDGERGKTLPTLDIYSDSARCGQPSGFFEILELERQGSEIGRLRVRFRQDCAGHAKRWIRGRFCVNCSGLDEPEPVQKFPLPLLDRGEPLAGLPRSLPPSAVALADGPLARGCRSRAESYGCLTEPGEGSEPGVVRMEEGEGGPEVRVSADGIQLQWPGSINVSFHPPNGEFLAPGAYYAFDNRERGEWPKVWAQNGRWGALRCGRKDDEALFVVDELEMDASSRLLRFAASFELRCRDRSKPPVFGRVCHRCDPRLFRQGRPTVPFPEWPPPEEKPSRGLITQWAAERAQSAGMRLAFTRLEEICGAGRPNYLCRARPAGSPGDRSEPPYVFEPNEDRAIVLGLHAVEENGIEIRSQVLDSRGSLGRGETLVTLHPADGQRLEVGLYVSPPKRHPREPFAKVSIPRWSTDGGRFEITEIDYGPSGRPIRLGINLEAGKEGAWDDRVGEWMRICIGCAVASE